MDGFGLPLVRLKSIRDLEVCFVEQGVPLTKLGAKRSHAIRSPRERAVQTYT